MTNLLPQPACSASIMTGWALLICILSQPAGPVCLARQLAGRDAYIVLECTMEP